MIYLMDYLSDGERTGGFQFLAITKSNSLSTVPSGFLSTIICLERIPLKACGIRCKNAPRKSYLRFCASHLGTPGLGSFLTDFAGDPSASQGIGRTVSTPL